MGIEHQDIKKGSRPLVPEFLHRNIESCIVLNISGAKLKLFTTEGLEYIQAQLQHPDRLQ